MNIKKLFLCGLMAICGMAAVSEAIATDGRPHIQRSGTNLVTNPDLNGNINGWSVSGAVYDGTVSRDGGTGSMKMTAVGNSAVGDYLSIPTSGKTYTFAFYMRSSVFPSVVPELEVTYYNSSHVKIRDSTGSGRFAVTTSNSWQECVFLVRPQAGEAYARFKVWLRNFTGGYTGLLWFDNFYFGENIGFEQPPTDKVPFNGTQTRVDYLGNVTIYKDSAWQAFFPIAIYGDGDRPNWSDYSAQGFNMEMRNSDYVGVQRSLDATSTFNPDGMMSGLDISSYMLPGSNYNNTALLQSRINDLKTYGLMDNVLWYYWDNEAYGEWTVPQNIISTVRAADRDVGNNLMRPIYALQGFEGLTRMFSNSQVSMTDIVGDYVTLDSISAPPDETRGALGLITIGNLEHQQNPVVIAQLNHGVGILFRPRVFNAIAKGAKGIGFWKDEYQGTDENFAIDITSEPWWSDLPNIRREIDQLLPVIQMPHWTSWSLSSNNSLIDFGTRDYRSQGYVIVTNEQSTAQSVTFTISGLTSYTPTVVKNFFTHEIESAINSSQFTVSIPAYGSKVYVLEDMLEETLQFYMAFSEASGSSTVADWSFFANNGSVLNGAALDSGLLTLDGTNDRINCGHAASLDIGTSDISIAARIKLDTTQNAYSGIITKGAADSTVPGYAFVYYPTEGDLRLLVGNGTNRQTLDSNNNLNLHDNAWHTVGVSLNRNSNNSIFYVDGSSVGSETLTVSGNFNSSSYDVLVGSWIGSHHLKGQINNVKVYRKALDSQEMADLSNCILDQDMNHSISTTAVDASLYGNDGTLLNGAAVGSGVLTLDGSNDRVNLGKPASLEINTQSITIIARVKLDTTQNPYSGIITKGAADDATAGYAFVYYPTEGDLRLLVSNGTNRQTLDSNNSLNLHDNAWHTVGVSYDRGTANTATFYVDGNVVGSEVSTITGNLTNTAQDALIGSWIGSHHFKGQIDRVKVYKRALSSSEMQYITKQWNR